MMACRDACGRTSTVLSQLFENVPRNIATILEGYTHTSKGKKGILQTVEKRKKRIASPVAGRKTQKMQENTKKRRKMVQKYDIDRIRTCAAEAIR